MNTQKNPLPSYATGAVSRLRSIAAFAVATLAIASQGAIVEYFVDGVNGDDAYDGTSSNYVSGVVGPKKTIQAAVDLTKDDDVVTVLPGVYDTGTRTYDSSEFRVVITNRIVVRSLAGREVTHIVGKRAATADGTGAGAVRGVAMRAVPYIVVEGFTIRDCACSKTERTGDGNSYTGAATCGAWNDYVVDCVIRNCAAVEGAVGYRGTFARCLMEENYAQRTCITADNAYFHNCVIRHNKCGTYLFNYPKKIVNCTIVENRPVYGLWAGSAHDIFNTLLVDINGNQGDASYSSAYSIITTEAQSMFKASDANCVFEASRFQLMAPAKGDFRLLSTSDAVGAGSSDHLSVVALYHPNATWSSYLSDKYRNADYTGQTIVPNDGKVNCGAVQATATAEGGRIVFETKLNYNAKAVYQFDGSDALADYSYAHAARLGEVVKVRAAMTSGASVYAYTVDPHPIASQLYQFPMLDGWLPVAFPAEGVELAVVAVAANKELYVDRAKGADSNDGSATNSAFRTLQAAVDASSSSGSSFTLIHVAPGVYDEGGAPITVSGIDYGSNRVMITKSVSLVATEGPEKTFIVGAPDPETGGCGPNAVRCVYQGSSSRGSSIRGFTLTGGYTRYDTSTVSGVVSERGSALCGSLDAVLDCVISNNFAKFQALERGLLIRCKVIKNKSFVNYVASGTWLVSSLVADNDFPADGLAFEGTKFIATTAEGGLRYNCVATGGIFFNGNSANLTGDMSHGNVTWGTTISGNVMNTLAADPMFIDASVGDYRLKSYSPAIGGAQVTNAVEFAMMAPVDMEGCAPVVKAGVPTAGAYRRPLQAIVVSGLRGSIDVTGGTLGTNYVAAGTSISVEASSPSPSGREFLGLTVDGVDLPKSQTIWSYTAPYVWDGVISHEVQARYGTLGFVMKLR